MSSPKSDASSARRALRLGGLLLTLAGLFGMHGLASHGTAEMGADHSGHPAASSTAPSTHSSAAGSSGSSGAAAMVSAGADATAQSADAAHAAHAVGTVVVGAATALDDPAGGVGMDMGGAGMCLAVLLLTALALLVGASARGVAPALFLRARPARAPVIRTYDPHPPDLYVLSIQRC